jgi:hypothetical protein
MLGGSEFAAIESSSQRDVNYTEHHETDGTTLPAKSECFARVTVSERSGTFQGVHPEH